MPAWPIRMSLRPQYLYVVLSKNNQGHPTKHLHTRFLSPIFCVLAFLFSCAIYQSFRADLKQSGSWGCEMSWMSPSYSRLEWTEFISTKYALYLYREQGWDSEDTLSGHPVLFIPGNAGSYQQVRSVASSTSKQFYEQMKAGEGNVQTGKKIDFFTADLKEEFSAFHARTLREQAVFIQHCIRRILQEYTHLPEEKRPTQITLLAHSMGGVVARLAMDPATSISVDIIVTLSTPHILPPLALERDMDSIYSLITWRRQHISTHPPLISVCGGISDTQVVSDSCALPSWQGQTGNNSDFAVFATGIPGVWTAVEHQAIVWCHQIRWRIARMLLDMSINTNTAAKLVIARKWLLDEQEDETFNGTHNGRLHDYSVSSPNMTFIRLQQPSKAFVAQQCSGLEPCRAMSSVMRLLPFPRNSSDPFPLPGEGIKPNEVMLAAEVSLPSTSTVIKTSASKYGQTIAGSREYHLVKGNSWSEFTIAKRHIRIQLLLCIRPTHTSTLSFYRGTLLTLPRQSWHSSGDISIALMSCTTGLSQEGLLQRTGKISDSVSYGRSCVASGLGCCGSSVTIIRLYQHRLVRTYKEFKLILIGEILPWNAALEGIAGRWMPICIALILLGATIQSQLPNFPMLHTFFLGVNQLQMVPLVGILAVWTFGLLCIVSFHLYSTCAIFTTLLIPFNILQLAIWSRNIWTGSAAIINTDSNFYYAIPPVLLVKLASCGGTIQKRHVYLQACRIALMILIVASFSVGGRWTWILPPIANAVLILFLASIM
ncbi:GPI inositol-deacylase [Cryptococcus bacillisporus CA1873]|uniref:GPI inositol-deacylase n=1 Tax=Cryptococcus bacillisporus CA1873 TaxID=1296111 RepID=A0ABR5BCZ6_CRYGA|nr:GPI inositol-deacylase [Cryptococcus bacillisporus CA1873]|eukprot:KIR64172.1 GPI inositol-deacylase [Cryptococcus gattii CA1873]